MQTYFPKQNNVFSPNMTVLSLNTILFPLNITVLDLITFVFSSTKEMPNITEFSPKYHFYA